MRIKTHNQSNQSESLTGAISPATLPGKLHNQVDKNALKYAKFNRKQIIFVTIPATTQNGQNSTKQWKSMYVLVTISLRIRAHKSRQNFFGELHKRGGPDRKNFH